LWKWMLSGNTLWQTNGFTNFPGSPRAVVLNGTGGCWRTSWNAMGHY
jgi:hypothetical protein